MELPEEVQKDLVQYQALQNQLNALINQVGSMKLELSLIEEAKKELENSEGDVYRLVGPILIKKDRDEVKKWLEDREEMLNVKIRSLEKKIEALQNTLLQLKNKIEAALKAQGGPPAGQ